MIPGSRAIRQPSWGHCEFPRVDCRIAEIGLIACTTAGVVPIQLYGTIVIPIADGSAPATSGGVPDDLIVYEEAVSTGRSASGEMKYVLRRCKSRWPTSHHESYLGIVNDRVPIIKFCDHGTLSIARGS